MWKSYIIRAWRSIMRNRMFAFVNIAGLSLAVTVCLLIGLFIRYEWSYDMQSPQALNIWRAYNETIRDGKVVTKDANTHAILGPSLKADLPEIKDFTRLYNHGSKEVNVVHEDVPYKVTNAWMTDPGFLRMFPQKFISGNAATSLKQPYTIVLTESTAKQLFKNKNPVGQVLQVPGGWLVGSYTVTGVVADPPKNTHLKFALLASYESRHAQGHQDNWGDYWEYTYFQLAKNADPAKVKKQLAVYSDKHLKAEGIRLNMQPFTSIHLNSRLTYEIEPNSDAGTIQSLAIIALIILGIALINYINLTTAASLVRAKEVGVRKVLGANRKQLIRQFLFEGGLVSLIAVILGLVLLWVSLPWFEKFLDRPLVNYQNFQQSFWLLVPGIWLLALLGACLYPAISMSAYSPIKTMRGSLGSFGRNSLRRVLVVFQFTCSIALIISIFVIVKQMRFLREHDKGLSLDKIIAFKVPDFDWRNDSVNNQRINVFRQKTASLTGVKSIASSSIVPTQGIATISGTSGGLFWTQNPTVVTPSTIYFYNVEPKFFSTYSIAFLAGKPYEPLSHREANQNIVINETALNMFGFKTADAALGQEVAYKTNPGYRMKIHGVVSDFHIESSREPVRPTLYLCSPALTHGYLSVKADGANMPNLLQNIQQVWKEVFPESHFEFSFLDEKYKQQYLAEEQLAIIVSGFTMFAIFIACIGLFALAFISAKQRLKEIGIRKVLGATVSSIVAMLSADFLKLIVIAAVLAFPISWWAMETWLQDFAYRINISWWVFLLAGVIAIVIAFLTISLQAIKAALANPVKNLRAE